MKFHPKSGRNARLKEMEGPPSRYEIVSVNGTDPGAGSGWVVGPSGRDESDRSYIELIPVDASRIHYPKEIVLRVVIPEGADFITRIYGRVSPRQARFETRVHYDTSVSDDGIIRLTFPEAKFGFPNPLDDRWIVVLIGQEHGRRVV